MKPKKPKVPASPVAPKPDFEILEMGHCDNGYSDKVWGYFRSNGAYGAFWGKRLGPWTFKVEAEYGSYSYLSEKMRGKQNSGYAQVYPYSWPGYTDLVFTALSKAAFFDVFHRRVGS